MRDIERCVRSTRSKYLLLKQVTFLSRTGSLETFLHHETGVDQEAILAYLSDGRRLMNDNIRELAGAQDQVLLRTMFVLVLGGLTFPPIVHLRV